MSWCLCASNLEGKQEKWIVGMQWGWRVRLIFLHILIKPDLQGFSHLLECAPLAVKLNPVLSENMPSPPDRL